MDTHTWIWLMQGEKLSAKVKDRLESAAAEGQLFISAISVWELSLLVQKGRLELPLSVDRFVDQALENIRCVDVNHKIALSSNLLPGDFHADPGDRMIVATARELMASLVTSDEKIINYGKEGHLNVIPL
jgi:PIN domain nuclease of toxin-antitoxin system